MRELIGHKVNDVNDGLTVTVLDGPGPGGASHSYEIRHTETDPSKSFMCVLYFHNGPIKEVGVNGITHEVLLCILVDRLEGFESGPYKCPENAMALSCLRSAQRELKARTESRDNRGVEGTMTV